MSFVYSHPFTGLANGLNTMQGGGAVGGWVELGRTTLGAAADTITVSSLADKRYYMLLFNKIPDTNATVTWQVNNDTGTNYSVRQSTNGGTDSTFTSQDDTEGGDPVNSTPSFTVAYVANRSANEKLATQHVVSQNTAGAGTAPARMETVWKWANTSNAINRFDQKNLAAGAGDYDVGSEVVVLGWDPDDTHTNNFWTELVSVDTNGTGDADTGTFTAKKYLWIQVYLKNTDATTTAFAFRCGNSTIDTGTNYARRYSGNGGADGTSTSSNHMDFTTSSMLQNETGFANFFVINNASNEKLFIGHSVDSQAAGAANTPERKEMAMKWANTSNQMNIFGITDLGTASTFDYKIKIWGAD